LVFIILVGIVYDVTKHKRRWRIKGLPTDVNTNHFCPVCWIGVYQVIVYVMPEDMYNYCNLTLYNNFVHCRWNFGRTFNTWKVLGSIWNR
jgi:hypothetical protein